MALMERLFPVTMWNGLFFTDDLFRNMEQEMRAMDEEILRMRKQMHSLMPCEDFHSIRGVIDQGDLNMQVSHPIVEEKGQTKLQLRYDVSQFKPEEVKVKVLGDNILQVFAKHEEESDSGVSASMYVRQYKLPPSVKADEVKPVLTDDGVLTIEAPAAPLSPKEKMIPIEFPKK